MKAVGFFDNDCFVELIPVHKDSEVKDLGEFVCSNQDVSFESFYADLKDHEEKFNKSKSIRYGAVLTILFDQKRDNDVIKQIADRLIAKYDNLPYFCFKKTVGQGFYIVMYICERHYFKEGKIMPVLLTSDRYIDPKTGRLCKKDAPNAVLNGRKGTPSKRSIFTKFTYKKDCFRYANEKEFAVKMEQIKLFIVDLLKEICHANIRKDLSIKKYRVCTATEFQRPRIAMWNRCIRKIEAMLSDATEGLALSGALNDSSFAMLANLRNQFMDMLLDGQFVMYNRFTVYISFRRRFYNVTSNCDMFLQKFTYSLQQTMKQIYSLY